MASASNFFLMSRIREFLRSRNWVRSHQAPNMKFRDESPKSLNTTIGAGSSSE